MRQFCLTAAALCVVLLAATATAQTTTDANTPPPNATATDPYWPELPAGRSISDYTLNDSASDADLAGATDVARWIIEASNQFRGEFGSQPVTWNETAARVAQNHTNTCLWEHWGNDNLAQQSASDASMRFDVRSMIQMWADEWTYYPFAHPEEQAYSHFTAMVWNASTTVGCGWNVGCANTTGFPSMTYFVCNYWPGGNIVSSPPGIYFAANVRNFTGWPVDAAAESVVASLTSQAGGRPTGAGMVAGESGGGGRTGGGGGGAGQRPTDAAGSGAAGSIDGELLPLMAVALAAGLVL